MNKDFPKYWGSIEELEQAPEFQKNLGKEFLSPPAENLLSEMERRDFLKLMGAGMLLATTACYRRPVEKIIPYVNRPEEIIPGIADWYTSTCGECSAGCGILVKTREGRPIKLEGNDAHPLNKGGMCARGIASILNLYDPDRLKNPVVVSRADGSSKDLTWSEVDDKIKNQLDTIKQKAGKIYLLTGAINSPSTLELIRDFLSKYPGAVHVAYEGVVPEEIALAQELSFGQKVTPRYRFDQAKLIVSFGADFLGTYLSPIEFTKQFSKSRKVEHGSMNRFVCFESGLSLTGTNADEHFPVKPGDEFLIALALAHEIVVARKQSRYAGDSQVVQALKLFDVDSVSKQTGVKPEALRRVVDELWAKKGEGLILGGAVKARNGLPIQVIVNLLNSIFENDGVTVDYSVSPSNQAMSSYADLLKMVEQMRQGKVAALFIYKNNPVYNLSSDVKFADALAQVPFVVNFSDREDETGALSNYICPDSHYLESWSDASPQKGLYSIVQPTIAPIYQTRPFQDSLIQWAELPYKSWYDYLKNQWQQKIYRESTGSKSFESFWDETLQKGFFDALGERRTAPTRGNGRRFSGNLLESLKTIQEPSGDYVLALYPSVSQYDGRSANNAWLQELPESVSRITWENFLSVSPRLAKKLDLQEGDVVRVGGAAIDMELPIHIQPKLHEQTVMVAVGYGRTRAGRVGNKIGVNSYTFQKSEGEWLEWSGRPVSIAKTGRNENLASVQGHNSIDGRPILKETTYQEYLKNPEKLPQEEPLPTMWSGHEYKTYRWGMAIDVNSCIGCNACMIGCQSENNVPSVGKEQVIKGREMHWIRIDRYYSGDVDQPDVTYQPMLCQHCENAPCETVCPVLATTHSDEGLNMQIYNRCVGTRYCSNNCPYKVRRFNFFNYFKWDLNNTQPIPWVLNPDVTVRSRGVMEKCTFCIQRIQEAKGHAKDLGRPVQDGEIKTACQQSCPSEAIVFGNINDPNSRVSQLKKLSREFHVLEDLNVKPQVTYLEKVRNKNT
jgi:MoCo/4Fe-4S cofactor protein with predicted Tat translocation signal